MALYKVNDNDAPEGSKPRLVKALSAAAAIKHVTGARFTADTITKIEDAADLMADGIKLEVAGEEPEPEPVKEAEQPNASEQSNEVGDANAPASPKEKVKATA